MRESLRRVCVLVLVMGLSGVAAVVPAANAQSVGDSTCIGDSDVYDGDFFVLCPSEMIQRVDLIQEEPDPVFEPPEEAEYVVGLVKVEEDEVGTGAKATVPGIGNARYRWNPHPCEFWLYVGWPCEDTDPFVNDEIYVDTDPPESPDWCLSLANVRADIDDDGQYEFETGPNVPVVHGDPCPDQNAL